SALNPGPGTARPVAMAATAAATADTAPSDTSARTSTPGAALERGRGLMKGRCRASSGLWRGVSSAAMLHPTEPVCSQPMRVAIHRGWECVGIRRGYDGLLDEDRVVPLDANAVRGITHLGGTILGTTNRGDPSRWRGQRADGSAIEHDRADELVAAFHRKGIDALIAIGGDG